MSDDPLSTLWYRVAALRPRLAAQARIARHRYRRQSWYVLHDPLTARVYRFTPQTYLLLAQMDGVRTLDEIWTGAIERLGDAAPTQDELIQLVGRLHAADVLVCDIPPDTREIIDRAASTARRRWLARLGSPLFMRFPLWDPDRFLERAAPWLKFVWRWQGAVLWAVLVAAGCVVAALNWEELTANLSDRVLSAGNLALLWLVFPLVKFLHELGHATATKLRGGEVHELGLMLMVFTPIPYVDGTAANAFRSKWDRALVGAAGMLVETALAALALFAWVSLEPGLLRAVCFNVILIAGVSTIVFNVNPLLRFDGYYILADLLEIPNLALRSKQFLTEWIDRRVFGATVRQPMLLAPGERVWLALYQPLSSLYRLAVMLSIALFLANAFFFIGVALALWALAQGLLWPLAKGLWHVFGSAALAQRRRFAATVALAGAAAAALLLFAVPAPNRALAEGVIWPPEDAQVRALSNGFVQQVSVAPGTRIEAESAILSVHEPTLDAQIEAQAARVEQFEAELASVLFSDRTKASVLRQTLESERAALERLLDEAQRQAVVARSSGVLELPRAADLPGRYVRSGELLGYIHRGEIRTIRVVVAQEDIERVRRDVRGVSVRLVADVARVLPAHVLREVPAGRDELPTPALSTAGGGEFAPDPRDRNGLRTLNRVFQFDVEMLGDVPSLPIGSRAHVRFELVPEALGLQAYRRLRQLFLSRLDV